MPRKKALVVTYHNSYSYGACLQAWATWKLFDSLGIDANFIDYKNPIEEESLGVRVSYFLKKGDMKKALKTAARNAMGYREYAQKGFSEFHRSLPKTSASYRSLESLKSVQADILVVGSDQMWNPAISGGIDPVFLLDFGSADVKLSLATSMGNYDLDEGEETEAFKKALAIMDHISVREKHTKKQVDRISGRDAFLCIDPTLMVRPETWRDFSKKPVGVGSEPYLLVFTLNTRSKEEERAWMAYSDRLDLPVYRIINNRFLSKGINENLRGVAPQEFVWLVDHAGFVCTDSFHGTAFSINLETPFVTFPSKTGNNVRMLELLDLLHLPSRFDALDSMVDTNIRFEPSRDALEHKREESLAWLKNAVSSDRV